MDLAKMVSFFVTVFPKHRSAVLLWSLNIIKMVGEKLFLDSLSNMIFGKTFFLKIGCNIFFLCSTEFSKRKLLRNLGL